MLVAQVLWLRAKLAPIWSHTFSQMLNFLEFPVVFRSSPGVSTMTVTTKSLSLFGISGAGQVGRICVAVGMDIDNYRGGAHHGLLGLACLVLVQLVLLLKHHHFDC